MSKEKGTGRSILAAGAGIAFCGALLYATGQTLSFLFRDVDPKQIAAKKNEPEKEESEDTADEGGKEE